MHVQKVWHNKKRKGKCVFLLKKKGCSNKLGWGPSTSAYWKHWEKIVIYNYWKGKEWRKKRHKR
jgi:hypothetical protein